MSGRLPLDSPRTETWVYDQERITYWKRALWYVVLGALVWSCVVSILGLMRVWGDDDLMVMWVANNIAHCSVRAFVVAWLVVARPYRRR